MTSPESSPCTPRSTVIPNFVVHGAPHGQKMKGSMKIYRPVSARPIYLARDKEATDRPHSARTCKFVTNDHPTQICLEPVQNLHAEEWLDKDYAQKSRSGTFSEVVCGEKRRVPKLVLSGVPTSPFSQRAALARQAQENRQAVKDALDAYGLDDARDKWKPPPKVFFSDSAVQPAQKPYKAPTAQQMAEQLGARLDPVHPERNPARFEKNKTEKTEVGLRALSIPADLQDLSFQAKLLANAKALREKVKAASEVTSIIGVRRPGYNPLLRKYDQRMPKEDAMHLACGRPGMLFYPQDEATRGGRLKLSTEDNKKEGDNGKENARRPLDNDLPHKQLRWVARLAQHKIKPPGSQEARTGMTWYLKDELRTPRRERNVILENLAALQHFDRHTYEAGIKQRTTEHFRHVRRNHEKSVKIANEAREKILVKEKMREERLFQNKRLQEMQEEREIYQRNWLKQLLIFHSAQLFLFVATVGTEKETSTKESCTQYLYTNKEALALARRSRVSRNKIQLKNFATAQKLNTCAIIRWCFETRRLIGGKKYNAIYRFMIHFHYKRQIKYFLQAAKVMRQTIATLAWRNKTMTCIHTWKAKVIKCQRVFRRACIRRDQHLLLVISQVKDFSALTILREMLHGVTSIFPASSAFSAKHDMHIMRPCDLNRVTITREERHNYQLCFPGLPIWICVALEKLSSELMKAYADEYSESLSATTVWETLTQLFKNGAIYEQDCKEITWKIYNELSQQCRMQWEDYFQKKVLYEMNREQEVIIEDALKNWSSEAIPYWEAERAKQRLAVSFRLKRPSWPTKNINALKVTSTFHDIFALSLQSQEAKQRNVLVAFNKTKNVTAHQLEDETQAERPVQTRSRGPRPRAWKSWNYAEDNSETLLEELRTKIVNRVLQKNAAALSSVAYKRIYRPPHSKTEQPTQDQEHKQVKGSPGNDALLESIIRANPSVREELDVTSETLPQSNVAGTESDHLKERLMRQQGFFNVRVNTEKAFRAILKRIPHQSQHHHQPHHR